MTEAVKLQHKTAREGHCKGHSPCKNLLKPLIFFFVVTAEVYLKHYYSTINVFLQSVLMYNIK